MALRLKPPSLYLNTKLPRDNDRCLLAHSQRSIIRIRTHILGNHRQIRDLQSYCAVHIQTPIHYTPLLPRRHLARPQRMPRRAQIAPDPLVDRLVVFGAVFDILDLLGIGDGASFQRRGTSRWEFGMAEFELACVVGEAAGDLAGHLVGPALLLDVAGVVEEAGVEVVAGQDVSRVVDVDTAPGVRVGGVAALLR